MPDCSQVKPMQPGVRFLSAERARHDVHDMLARLDAGAAGLLMSTQHIAESHHLGGSGQASIMASVTTC